MVGESGEHHRLAGRTRHAVVLAVGAVEESAGGHTAVLLPQVLTALNIQAGGTYMDATYGRGGHAGAILEKLIANGRLISLDRDPEAVAAARARFSADPRFSIFLAPFSALAAVADQVRPGLKLDGILFDLGVSSPQIDDASRGFSFMQDGPLDMRMTAGEGMSAADVVNGAPLEELIRIFREFGEERMAPRIARAIVADRQAKPFERTLQLAEMIARVARSTERHKHPATRVFQALRIYVNGELKELETALDAALERLAPHGRLAVISFHSLEDRMVKLCMRSPSCASSVKPKKPTTTKSPSIRARAARTCASPNVSIKELQHEISPLAAAHFAGVMVGRIGVRRAGDLRAPQGARYVRAARETQRRTRLARHRVGPLAARAKLLVLARLRRTRGQLQIADEHPADSRCEDRPPVKLRPGENQRPAKSYRWRSAVVLGLVVLGAIGLAARAVELQLLDHGFLAKQGDDRSMRVVKIAAHRGAITDRNGEPLAVSTPVDSVWVNPQELNENIDQLPKLSKALKEDQ